MNNINPIIMDALLKNNNMVTTSQVQELGFSKQTLNNYVKAGLLERIRQGLYITPDAVHDDMYSLMLRSESIMDSVGQFCQFSNRWFVGFYENSVLRQILLDKNTKKD